VGDGCTAVTGSFREGARSSREVPLISVIFLIGAQIFCPQKGFPLSGKPCNLLPAKKDTRAEKVLRINADSGLKKHDQSANCWAPANQKGAGRNANA